MVLQEDKFRCGKCGKVYTNRKDVHMKYVDKYRFMWICTGCAKREGIKLV